MPELTTCFIENLFDLDHTIARDLFTGKKYPWEVLDDIGDFIRKLGPTLDPAVFEQRGEGIWIAKSVTIASTATLNGPLIIDEGTEVRPGAFARGNAIVGKNSVVGNSTELKNVVLFDHVEVPHYNYVGDSILGYYAHMGAGSITSNIKSDRKNIVIHGADGGIETGRRKIGAMLGDHVEVGCNSVLNPGTIIGRNTNIYPVSCVRGVVPADSIWKNESKYEIVPKTAE